MIQDFIAEVRTRGLARTNRYEVNIPFPSNNEWNTTSENAQLTNLFCESVQVPGLNISTQPTRIYGEAREMPYERTFEPIQMMFYVDAAMQVKTAFDRWLAMIIHPQTRTIGYYNDYVRDITINILTVDDETPMTIKLFEAYPKMVGSVQMSHESKDVFKLPVTFQYKYWQSMNWNTSTRQSPPPVLRGTGASSASPQGILANDPPVTEDEIVSVEDRIAR